MSPHLAPHQQKAVKQLANGKILRGDVGTGKTRTALAWINDAEDITEAIYVITTAKKRDSGDWQDEAQLFGLHPKVDSWHHIDDYENVRGAIFIFDEQRLVGSGQWVKSFLKITKNNQWILLSATPGDSWLDYIPVFLANGFYRSRIEFQRRHVQYHPYTRYPKIVRYLETDHLASLLRSVLVEMPYERHTTRKQIDVYVEYDRDLFATVWTRRWNFLEERPIRHVSELYSLARRVTNDHPSRLSAIQDLLVTHPKMIVFYNFDYELEALRGLEVTKAEWNGHRHEAIPETEEWLYLVQYSAGAEGWNCVSTDTTVFYSLTYSYRQFEQAKGRTDRLNTEFTELNYYVLRCSSIVDRGIALAIASKKDFNEAAYLREVGQNRY